MYTFWQGTGVDNDPHEPHQCLFFCCNYVLNVQVKLFAWMQMIVHTAHYESPLFALSALISETEVLRKALSWP